MKPIKFIILATVCLICAPSIMAQDVYVIAPEDPLLLIGSARLDPIIRALRTKDKVELLLGSGVAVDQAGSVVHYVVVEADTQETRFVRSLEVRYAADGSVVDVRIPYETRKLIVSPKVCAGYLARQVPATVDAMGRLIDRTFHQDAPGEPEAKSGQIPGNDTKPPAHE